MGRENYIPMFVKKKLEPKKARDAGPARRSLLAQMCRCADALVENSDPLYVLHDPYLSRIGEERWKNMGVTKFPY